MTIELITWRDPAHSSLNNWLSKAELQQFMANEAKPIYSVGFIVLESEDVVAMVNDFADDLSLRIYVLPIETIISREVISTKDYGYPSELVAHVQGMIDEYRTSQVA